VEKTNMKGVLLICARHNSRVSAADKLADTSANNSSAGLAGACVMYVIASQGKMADAMGFCFKAAVSLTQVHGIL
jgi:hypothetical protein